MFTFLDKTKIGFLEASKFAFSYDSSKHPEVIAGRLTSERALKEFLELFDVIEGKIILQSFIDYYNMIGSSIQNDDYFYLLLQNTWHHNEQNNNSNDNNSNNKDNDLFKKINGKYNKVKEPSSISFPAGGSVGIAKSNYAHTAQLGWIDNDDFDQFEGYGERNRSVGKEANDGERLIIINIQKELCSRTAADGYIKLQRLLNKIDKDNNKLISLYEFIKICKDIKLNLNDTECRVLFNHFDRENKGLLNYEYFIDGIRPKMSQKRFDLVNTAFKCLDINNVNILDGSFIVNSFDASGHPDVFLGTKNIDELTQEWLNNFDIGATIKGKMTKNEFINYYSNISAVISNEDYFELLLIHAWKSQNNFNQISEDFDPENSSYDDNNNSVSDFKYNQNTIKDDVPIILKSPSMNNWIGSNNKRNEGKSELIPEQGGSNRHYPPKKSQIHFI